MGWVSAEPEAWQELHSPTEDVTVKLDATRTTHICRRRKADARLFDSLDGDQERAADRIVFAFTSITGPVAVKIQSFDHIPGQTPDGREEYLSDVKNAYVAWGQECFRQQISHSAIMDILVYNRAAGDVDACRRKRKGWAKDNLVDGLTLYCKLAGWK